MWRKRAHWRERVKACEVNERDSQRKGLQGGRSLSGGEVSRSRGLEPPDDARNIEEHRSVSLSISILSPT
jgi:hypothetical protein